MKRWKLRVKYVRLTKKFKRYRSKMLSATQERIRPYQKIKEDYETAVDDAEKTNGRRDEKHQATEDAFDVKLKSPGKTDVTR